jgi:hypothetical protein
MLMQHSEFVQLWKEGRIEVDVDRSLALKIANSNILPARYRITHIFWSWMWVLTVPVAFAVMYYYRWWAGVLILLLTPVIYLAQ